MSVFLNVYYVTRMELSLLSVNQIMRHCPHLDVHFNNHKCYTIDKRTKKTIAPGVKDRGLFKLIDIGQVKETCIRNQECIRHQ